MTTPTSKSASRRTLYALLAIALILAMNALLIGFALGLSYGCRPMKTAAYNLKFQGA